MNNSHNNSQLDTFLRDALKNLDIQYQQSDWSDMESLLGSAHKPIDVNISKKTIFISASVLVIIVIGIIISQTVHFNNSSSEESSSKNTNVSPNILKTVDTQKTVISNPSVPPIDSAKKTSPAPVQDKIIDSAKAIALVDTTPVQKKNDKQKNATTKTNQKADKKQNNSQSSSSDSSSIKTNIPVPPVDTATKHPAQEIKIATPSAPVDSSKSTEHSRKSRKNKKQKNNSVDSTKAKNIIQAKPDSLKHQ